MHQFVVLFTKSIRSAGVNFFSLAAVFLAAAFAAAYADEAVFIEGKHYQRVDPAVSVEVPAGKIEVREFFWYGCPHCYALEPHIEKWKKPKDVVFVRTPALLGRIWVMHAYTYYALEALGRLDLHDAIFKALHISGMQLVKAGDMAVFLQQYEVDPEEFRQAMESFLVKTKIKNAELMASHYNLRSVPTMAVNGRYLITTGQFTNYKDVMMVVDFLVEKERDRLGRTQDHEPQVKDGKDGSV